MFNLRNLQQKSIIYAAVFVLLLSMIFNHSFKMQLTDELVKSKIDNKHHSTIPDNKQESLHQSEYEKDVIVTQVENSSRLASEEPATFSNENNKQYVHSFILGLEHSDIIKTLNEFLLSNDANVRMQTVRELASIDSESALKILVSALNDEDSYVRSEIIYALGNSKNYSEHFLGQVIFSEKDPFLRRQAVELLAFRGSPAAQSLVIAAQYDSNEQVREEAEYWIDSLAWDESIAEDENYNNIFFPDSDAVEKIDILQSVNIHFGQEEAVGIFRQVLLQEEDASVRLQSIRELSTIDNYQVEAVLATALGDDDTEVRFQAIEELGKYGSSATNLLGQAMFSDPDPELRRRAYELLIQQDEPAAWALISEASLAVRFRYR